MTETLFPSDADFARLSPPQRTTPVTALSYTDHKRWTAYMSAWRLVTLPHKPRRPSDEWHDPGLFALAEAYWRNKEGPNERRSAATPQSRHRITAAEEAEQRGDYEKAARFRAQDRERTQLLAAIPWERAGRREDGTPGVELAAFLACCMRQVRENLSYFDERSTRFKVVEE